MQNDVLDLLTDVDPVQDAAVSNVRVFTEQGGNPDQVAQARQLSRSVGLPEPAVQENMQQVKAHEWGRVTSSWLIDAPGTAQYLAEPKNAALSHDDVEGLRNIEMLRKQADAAPWWSQERRDLVHKLAQASVGEWDSTKAFREGEYRTNTLGPLYRRQYLNVLATGQEDPDLDVEIFRAEALAPERRAPEGVIDETVNAMFGQLPIWGNLLMERARGGIEGATAGAMAAAFGGPATVGLAPATALTGAAVGSNVRGTQAAFDLEADAAYGEFRKITDENGERLDPRIAATGALAVGTINAYLENLGFKTFAGLLPGGMEAGRRVVNEAIKKGLRNKETQQAILGVLGKFGSAGAMEGATEMGQELTNILFGELGKFVSEQIQGTAYADLDWGQAAQRIGQAGKEGMLAALGLGAGPTIASGIVQVRQAQSVQQFRDDQVALHDAILSSKTMQRDPVTMRNFGDILGIGEEVWIDAGALAQRGPEFLQRIGVVPEVVERAAADGQGIRLNTAELHYTLDQKEFSDLFEDIRPAPSAMSAREAAAYDPAQALKDVEEASVDIEATVAEVVQAKDRMRKSLEAVGLGETVDAQWDLATRMARYLSPKSDPLGFVKKLNVVTEGLASAQGLNQQDAAYAGVENQAEIEEAARLWAEMGTESPYFKRWSGGAPVVRKNAAPAFTTGLAVVVEADHGSPDARFVQEDGIFKSEKERYSFGRSEAAHWFTRDTATAKTYADPRRAFDYQNAEPGIVSAFVRLNNPLVIDAAGQNWRDAQKRGKTSDVIKEARDNGHDGVIIYNVKDDYNNGKKTKATTTLTVFSSNQIKSATGNRGTFDPADARILYQAAYAGANTPAEIEEAARLWTEMGTESPYFKRWRGGAPIVNNVSQYKGGPAVFVAFHGTTQDIEAFSVDKVTNADLTAFFHSTDPGFSSLFAQGDGGRIQKNYIKLDNVLDMREEISTHTELKDLDPAQFEMSVEDEDSVAGFIQKVALHKADLLEAAPFETLRNMLDGSEDGLKNYEEGLSRLLEERGYTSIAAYNDAKNNPNFFFNHLKNFVRESSSEITELLKALGYDGVIRPEEFDNFGSPVKNGFSSVAPFSPTQIKSATGNRGTFDPADPRIMYQAAYHGSPYRFDKFSLDHMGKGEGAQAYGYGLYFAGRKEVAEFYRGGLSYRDMVRKFRGAMPDDAGIEEALEWAESGDAPSDMARVIKALAEDDWLGFDYPAQALTALFKEPEAFAVSDETLAAAKAMQGQLYKVEIPEDDVMLHWDRPLSKQPEKVRDALRALIDKYADAEVSDLNSREDYLIVLAHDLKTLPSMKGNRIYHALKEAFLQDNIDSGYTIDTPSDKAASEYLNSLGIKGIKYLDGTSRSQGEGSYNYVIFDDESIQILEEFYQSQKNEPRGSYSQLKDGRHLVTLLEKANASTMPHELAHAFLTEIRAMVESGAADQDMIDDLAKIESWLDKEAVDGSPEWQSYYEDALGRGLTEEAAKADATFVLRHEKFSRGFEKYLWEGQAPTPELEGIFARFSRWLKRLYEDALAFGVTLNPEVRSVFDRMLKAEAETESKVLEIGFTPMTEAMAKHLGLGPDDRDYAIRLYASALEKAEAKLIKARNKGLKKFRADWREEAVAAAKQSREHLMVLALRKGRGLDPVEYEFTYSDDPFSVSTSAEVERIRYALAEVDAELSGLAVVRDEELSAYEKIIGQIRKSGGIGYDSAREQIGAEGISDLRDKFGPGFVTANGQALDLLVDKLSEQSPEFGLDREVQNLIDWLQRRGRSKKQILSEYSERKFELQTERKAGTALLAEAEGPVKVADKEKSARIRASVPSGVLKPGGMSSDEMAFEFGYDSGMEAMEALRAYRKPGDIAAEVVEAKTAEHDAQFNVEDFILDTKEFGAYQELMAKAYDKDGNVLSNKAFRDYARRIVASMPLADAMDVRSFLAAMARHHKAETKALKSGDLAAASQANKKARLNHAYAQEALNVKKRVQKVEALAKRLGKLKSGKIEEEHHKALLQLLSRFEFTKKDYAGLQDVPALADLVKMKDAFGAEEEATFSAWLLSGGQQNYKDLTSGEFEELADLMKFLYGTGKDLVNPALRASGLTMDEVRDTILPAMDKLPNRGKRRKEGTALRKIEDRVESYLSQNRTILWILRELDGYTALTGKTGPLESLLYDYLEAAQIKKAELSREMEKRTRSARTQLLKSAQAKPNKVSLVNLPVPAFWVRQGRVWDFDACLSVLMNMGNSVNKQRVMDGYGLSEADLQTILAVFSREDALAVQDIWSAMDDVLWPEIAKTHKSIRFFTPGKVQAEAFVMPDGTTLKGGYYPLKYDASADTRAAKNQDLDKAIQNPATAMLAKSVASGATKARAASAGGMPVMLRTSVLAAHLEWAAHYASHATIIHDLGRVLGDNKIAEAIKNTAGEETYRVANELVKRIANPRAGDAPSFLDRVFGRLTGISAVYGLWLNRFGPLTQPTAIGNYIVAEGGWGKGSAAWFRGAAHFLSAPGANWAWLMENNPALQSHFTLIRQKLTEAVGEDFRDIRLGKTKTGRILTATRETVTRGGIAMYGVMDAVVSVPGWYGSYLKGKDAGMSEADAMARANKVMAEYTPMSRDIDKTLFQHTKGMARAWTYMMSYFTKQANTNAGYWKAWRQGAIKTDQFIGQIIAVQLLPPLVVSMMYSMLTGDDDDRENVLLDAGLEVAAYPFAGLPFAREGAAFMANTARAAITGDSKKLGRNAFQMPGMMYFQLLQRAGSTTHALVQDLDDDEKQTKALMALLELTAASTGLPPVPKIAREVQRGLEDMDDDEGTILNVLIKPKFRKRD